MVSFQWFVECVDFQPSDTIRLLLNPCLGTDASISDSFNMTLDHVTHSKSANQYFCWVVALFLLLSDFGTFIFIRDASSWPIFVMKACTIIRTLVFCIIRTLYPVTKLSERTTDQSEAALLYSHPQIWSFVLHIFPNK